MYPYEIKPVDPELNKELLKNFHGEKDGFCQVGLKKYFLPLKFVEEAEGIYNMQVRPDDVWIVTLPRSGTTFCQEMIWLINNDLNYEYAAGINLSFRFPFLEFNSLFCPKFVEELIQINNNSEELKKFMSSVKNSSYLSLRTLPSPRHVKTHLAFSLLPPSLLDTSKVIYVARNPLDVVVSFYYHNRLLVQHDYRGSFEEYWNYFKKGLLIFFPYWDHILEAWKLRDHPNLLFLFYEDLIEDLPKAIKQVSTFLNKPMGEEQITKLAAHLKIDNFKAVVPTLDQELSGIKGMLREGEQGFVRKGKVGDTPEFTGDLEIEAKNWVRERLSKSNLIYPRSWKI